MAVNARAATFFADYRLRDSHSQLDDQAPTALHFQCVPCFLEEDFQLTQTRQPLKAGKVHFIRRVQSNQTVRVLNVDWHVPALADSGVWVTLDLQPTQTRLLIYDAAPDQLQRRCLIVHPFPLEEEVCPLPPIADPIDSHILQAVATSVVSIADCFFSASLKLLRSTFTWSLDATSPQLE